MASIIQFFQNSSCWEGSVVQQSSHLISQALPQHFADSSLCMCMSQRTAMPVLASNTRWSTANKKRGALCPDGSLQKPDTAIISFIRSSQFLQYIRTLASRWALFVACHRDRDVRDIHAGPWVWGYQHLVSVARHGIDGLGGCSFSLTDY